MSLLKFNLVFNKDELLFSETILVFLLMLL